MLGALVLRRAGGKLGWLGVAEAYLAAAGWRHLLVEQHEGWHFEE